MFWIEETKRRRRKNLCRPSLGDTHTRFKGPGRRMAEKGDDFAGILFGAGFLTGLGSGQALFFSVCCI